LPDARLSGERGDIAGLYGKDLTMAEALHRMR
jgi:hypothetical protein